MTVIYEALVIELGFDPDVRAAPLPLPDFATTVVTTPELADVSEALTVIGKAGLMTEGLSELATIVTETVEADQSPVAT